MIFRLFTKSSAIKPMWWSPEKHARSVKYTKRSLLFLSIVLLMFVLSGCSKAVSVVPMPLPPANLANNCPPLPAPPKPLTDPDRAIWELEMIAKYGDCAMRHRMTVDAWRDAVKGGK